MCSVIEIKNANEYYIHYHSPESMVTPAASDVSVMSSEKAVKEGGVGVVAIIVLLKEIAASELVKICEGVKVFPQLKRLAKGRWSIKLCASVSSGNFCE